MKGRIFCQVHHTKSIIKGGQIIPEQFPSRTFSELSSLSYPEPAERVKHPNGNNDHGQEEKITKRNLARKGLSITLLQVQNA